MHCCWCCCWIAVEDIVLVAAVGVGPEVVFVIYFVGVGDKTVFVIYFCCFDVVALVGCLLFAKWFAMLAVLLWFVFCCVG